MFLKKSLVLTPAVIVVKKQKWDKMPKKDYVVLEVGENFVRLGTYILKTNIDKVKVVKANNEERAIIENELL